MPDYDIPRWSSRRSSERSVHERGSGNWPMRRRYATASFRGREKLRGHSLTHLRNALTVFSHAVPECAHNTREAGQLQVRTYVQMIGRAGARMVAVKIILEPTVSDKHPTSIRTSTDAGWIDPLIFPERNRRTRRGAMSSWSSTQVASKWST
jgi:hypothetical protein